MKGKKATEQKAAMKELEQSIALVRAPDALQMDPPHTKVKVHVAAPQEENRLMEE